MNTFLSFSRQAYFSYRALFSLLNPLSYVVVKLLSPVLQVVFFALLAKAVNSDVSYLILGNSIRLLAVSGIFGVISVMQAERTNGTLSLLVASPTPRFIKFFSRGALYILDGLTSVALGLLFGAILFNLDFSQVNWLGFTSALLITSFAVSSLGYAAASFCLFGPSSLIIMNVIFSSMILLCGVNFPTSVLPIFFQYISQILPLTHGLEAIRISFSGNTHGVLEAILIEFVIGIVWLYASYFLFRLAESRALKEGGLDFY